MKTTSPSNKTLLVLTVLLVIGIVFWLWSISYKDKRMMHKMEDGMMMENSGPAMSEDTDLNKEIDTSMQSNTEIELKDIDKEF